MKTYQKIWDAAKVVLKEKFIAINKCLHDKNLKSTTFRLRNQKKKKNETKAGRKKELKIRGKINEMENRKK